jgi:hypothetical protein
MDVVGLTLVVIFGLFVVYRLWTGQIPAPRMKDRELIYRFALVGLTVAGVGLVATLLGQSGFGVPLVGLAYWLSVFLLIRPYVYERFGRQTSDWIMVTLILGPLTVLAAPILWWEHRRLAQSDAEPHTLKGPGSCAVPTLGGRSVLTGLGPLLASHFPDTDIRPIWQIRSA